MFTPEREQRIVGRALSSTTGRLAKCLVCGALTRARVWTCRLPLCQACVNDEAIVEYARNVGELERLIARRERRALLRAEGFGTIHDRFEDMADDALSARVIVALRDLSSALGRERQRRSRRSWRKVLACCPVPTQTRTGETNEAR
jgi:hypothetical protein